MQQNTLTFATQARDAFVAQLQQLTGDARAARDACTVWVEVTKAWGFWVAFYTDDTGATYYGNGSDALVRVCDSDDDGFDKDVWLNERLLGRAVETDTEVQFTLNNGADTLHVYNNDEEGWARLAMNEQ